MYDLSMDVRLERVKVHSRTFARYFEIINYRLFLISEVISKFAYSLFLKKAVFLIITKLFPVKFLLKKISENKKRVTCSLTKNEKFKKN